MLQIMLKTKMGKIVPLMRQKVTNLALEVVTVPFGFVMELLLNFILKFLIASVTG